MPLPQDRGHILTEHRHPASHKLDTMSVIDIVHLMANDHRDVVAAVQRAAPELAAFIDALLPRVQRGGRLIYIGAGTSGRLGVLDAAECPPTFQSDPTRIIGIIAGGDRSLRTSSEAKEDDPDGAIPSLSELKVDNRDTLLGIAAGGTTPYVLGAIRFAKSCNAMTGLITCAVPPISATECDHLIHLATGPEVLTGSTRLKAGSATKLALNIITTALFTKLGSVYSNLMVDMKASNAKLRDRAIRMLCELCENLSRDHAAETIEQAGGDLKTAILMHRFGLDRGKAKERLARHQRQLRAALEEANPSTSELDNP